MKWASIQTDGRRPNRSQKQCSVCRIVMELWREEVTKAIFKRDQLKFTNPVTYETLEIMLIKICR